MKKYEIEKELFNARGIINEIVEVSEAWNPYPNLPISFLGAVTFLANLMGARYTFNNLSSNMYNVIIADSGTGKDASRKVNSFLSFEIERMNRELMQIKPDTASIYRPTIADNIASWEGVEAFFEKDKNDLLVQIDEFDCFLQNLNDKRNALYNNISKNLLSYYTSSAGHVSKRLIKGNTDFKTFVYPNISIFGTCTPDAFFDAMDESMIGTGLIPRCFFLPAYTRSYYQEPKRIINLDLVEKLRKICEKKFATTYDELIKIQITDEAKLFFRELIDRLDIIRNDEAEDKIRKTLYTRVYEKTLKLAMVYAVSANYVEPLITAEIAASASKLAIQSTEYCFSQTKENLFNSVIEKRTKKIFDVMLKCETKNKITRRWIHRHASTNAAELDVVLKNLLDAGLIVEVKSLDDCKYYAIAKE